jgi:hypothetical protein
MSTGKKGAGVRWTAALAGLAALALNAGAARADTISNWMDTAFRYNSEATRPASPGAPPSPNPTSLAAPGRVAAAMYEAANAVDRRFEPYFGLPAAAQPASGEAAVSTAAHAVLIAVYPSKKPELDEALTFNLAAAPDGPAEAEGVRIGRAAAAAALGRVVFDPAVPVKHYAPPTTPGRYDSTTDPGPPPWAFTYRPWLLPSLKSVYPAPPPAVTSETYTRSFEETKRLGGRNSTERTPQQSAEAKFWRTGEGPEATLRMVFARPGRTLVENARLNALVQLARIDVVMVVDTSKLELLAWRPYTAIRLAETDGNAATAGDPSWEPLLRTPMTPEYPCGHCTAASNVAALMEAELGPSAADARFIADDMPAAAVPGITWSEYARRVGESRIFGGVHFRYSMDEGDRLGREIARVARERFARPLRSTR